MKRRRKTSKFKHSRSYSKPLFDPQRLLYFSTYNQRQGKVIRPKSSAVSQRAVTQTVDEQDKTLESLNQTLQFRIINRDGFKQDAYVYDIDDRPGYNGYTKYFDSIIDNYFDRTCPDYQHIQTDTLRLFNHSFAPYTPNIAISTSNANTISISRPEDPYTRNAAIHFIRGIIDTNAIGDDHIFRLGQVEVIDDQNLQSFTYWEQQASQEFSKIEIGVLFPSTFHVVTNPLSSTIKWQNIDTEPDEPTDDILQFRSTEKHDFDFAGFEDLDKLIAEGVTNTPLIGNAHDIFTTNINLPLRYHIVEFVAFFANEPQPLPPATEITYPRTTYSTYLSTAIIAPKLVHS